MRWLLPSAAGLVAVALAGCLLTTDLDGLSGAESPPPEAGTDGSVDAAPDGPAPTDAGGDAGETCSPTLAFDAPVPLGNMNTAAYEGAPRLSLDELTLYFESDRAGGAGGSDIYVASRASRAAPFAGATPLASVNEAGDEYTATLLPDGLGLALSSDRLGNFGVFFAKRATTAVPFEPPERVDAIEASAREAHPFFTLDGKALYFTSDRPGGAGGFDLFRSPVDATGIGAGARIAEVSGPTDEITPVLSADELTLIFSRMGDTSSALWRSQRASVAASWGAPLPIAELQADDDVYAGWMSPDSCRLYFYARTVNDDLDLFVADRSPVRP